MHQAIEHELVVNVAGIERSLSLEVGDDRHPGTVDFLFVFAVRLNQTSDDVAVFLVDSPVFCGRGVPALGSVVWDDYCHYHIISCLSVS